MSGPLEMTSVAAQLPPLVKDGYVPVDSHVKDRKTKRLRKTAIQDVASERARHVSMAAEDLRAAPDESYLTDTNTINVLV